ncbi:MAG: porin [Deltaproteobacteria bacterium]|nr:porin [Deltaproteobacteria bacterium]
MAVRRRRVWMGLLTVSTILAAAPIPGFSATVLEDLQKEVPILGWLKGVQASGFITGYYTHNLSGAPRGGTTANRRNDFRYNDLEANQFTLDMVELQLLKATAADSRLGFGVTANYGSTVRRLESAGFGTKDPLGMTTTNAFDFRQAFLTYKLPVGNGLDFKFGKFDALVGLELNAMAYNLNTSRGLLYWLTPATHTGVLLTYPLADTLTASIGLANGWDVSDDNNQGKTLLASFTATPAKNLSITLGGTYGAEQGSWGVFGKPSDDIRWIADLIVAYTPTDKLTVNFTADTGGEENNPLSIPPGDDNSWFGVGAIVKAQLTPTCSAAVRAEWVDDDGGAVVFKDFGFPVELADGTRTFLNPAFRAFDQKLWEVTLTGEYKFTDNFRTRLEYRHDQSNEKVFAGRADPVTLDVIGGRKFQDTVSVEFTALF